MQSLELGMVIIDMSTICKFLFLFILSHFYKMKIENKILLQEVRNDEITFLVVHEQYGMTVGCCKRSCTSLN